MLHFKKDNPFNAPTMEGAAINQLIRTQLLIGDEGLLALQKAKVLVVGVGGVGGYALEALARSGVGHIDVMDHDTVDITNLNRQVIALHSTLGQKKVEVAKERALDINPAIKINAYPVFYTPQIGEEMDFSPYDYVIDAIDNVTGKLDLICRGQKAGIPVISAMGAGNKMNPQDIDVADTYATSGCPLARIIRKELRKRGVLKQKVVYSKELALKPLDDPTAPKNQRKITPGSTAFVPAVAGLVLASEVIKDLIGWKK